MATATQTDFGQLGPQSRGSQIVTPWMDGSWEVTQGWGPSPFTGVEPEGHGYQDWHAGVDIGCDCGTQIRIPDNWGYLATVVQFSNPGGYGTGLQIKVAIPGARGIGSKPIADIYLGHLRQYLTDNGASVVAGQHIAISNNTGNSTGCHLHFEVRPPGGRYGTDIDPASWILHGQTTIPQGQPATADQNPYDNCLPLCGPQWAEWQAIHDIQAPLQKIGNEMLGIAQAGMGATMMLGGLILTGAGVRGMSAGQLGSSARSILTRPARPAPNLAPRQAPEGPPAEPTDATVPLSPQARTAVSEAAAGRGRRLSPEVSAELRRQRTPAQRVQAQRSRIRQSHQPRFQPGGVR